jgi:hypothetical protein
MKRKKFNKKLTLNKRTVSNLLSADMFNARGGVVTLTYVCNTCPYEYCTTEPISDDPCQPELGHTEYGDTCIVFCQ